MFSYCYLQRVTTTISTTIKKCLPNLDAGYLASKQIKYPKNKKNEKKRNFLKCRAVGRSSIH